MSFEPTYKSDQLEQQDWSYEKGYEPGWQPSGSSGLLLMLFALVDLAVDCSFQLGALAHKLS